MKQALRQHETIVIPLKLSKCTPHFVLGIVGVIQVGEGINKAEALTACDASKSALVMNQDRMGGYLDQIE